MSLPTPAIDALESATERLYSPFSQYHADVTARSPYAGISDAEVAKLQSRPLRELTVSDLASYARHALTTWGGVDEFKHFLPRIFELIVRHPFAFDPLVLEKLDAAEWRTWPRGEQEAVETYLAALWRWALSVGPDVVNAGDLLRGLGLAGYDLRTWLDAWRTDRSHTATEQIAHLVLDVNVDGGLYSRRLPSYWHPKDHEAVLSFLSDPDSKARIEAAFMAQPGGDLERSLADASDVLTRTSQ